MNKTLGNIKVSANVNSDELLEKIERLRQILEEAEILKNEISEFEINADIKILDA